MGTGVDLVSVPRFAAFRRRRGERGLRRLFAAAELDYCLPLARPDEGLAARFAAKEAFFKALGTGFGRGGRWTDVHVARTRSGRPELRLRGRAERRARDAGMRRSHLTLSHTAKSAVAFVVLES